VILTQRLWRDVPADCLTVGPTGRVWRTQRGGTATQPAAYLTDPEGVEAPLFITVDPHAFTTVIEPADPTSSALSVLSKFFPNIEMIG
jgi:hypothetical protein